MVWSGYESAGPQCPSGADGITYPGEPYEGTDFQLIGAAGLHRVPGDGKAAQLRQRRGQSDEFAWAVGEGSPMGRWTEVHALVPRTGVRLIVAVFGWLDHVGSLCRASWTPCRPGAPSL